jgi:hypothetical protein
MSRFPAWPERYPNAYWDDLRVPLTSTRAAANAPDFTQFKDNGAGSTGVFVDLFDKAADEQLFFSLQLPHSWMEGSDICPHVHWLPVANGGAGTDVSWGLEYTWANVDAVYGNTTIIYADTNRGGVDPLVANTQYVTEFADISGSGKKIGSMLAGRIFRDAAGNGGTDDYDDDAGLIQLDFHALLDSRGSRAEWSK